MTSRLKVLFVDDEVKILKSLKRGLIEEDYDCLFASSGKEALEILAKEEVAVVVSDMRMPEMNGLTLLKEVERLYPKTIKIVLSGYAQLSQIIATINQVDIYKYIMKPWDLENQFIGVIRSAIEYFCMKRDNEKIRSELGIKNKAYINIFNDVTNKIKIAKHKTKNMSAFGKSIVAFNANNLEKIYNYYSEIFSIEEYIYDHYLAALSENGDEDYSQSIIDELIEGLEVVFPDDNICIKSEFLQKKITEKKLVVEILLIYIEIYKSVYPYKNLMVIASLNNEEKPMISLVHKDARQLVLDGNNVVSQKVDLIDSFCDLIIQQMTLETSITFIRTKKDNNVVGVLTIG